MNKTNRGPVNRYIAMVFNKEGNIVNLGPVTAGDKRQAARLMSCEVSDVKCDEANVRKTREDSLIQHFANTDPVSLLRPKLILDPNMAAMRHRPRQRR